MLFVNILAPIYKRSVKQACHEEDHVAAEEYGDECTDLISAVKCEECI